MNNRSLNEQSRDPKDIPILILHKWLKHNGAAEDVIPVISEALTPKVNHKAVNMVETVLNISPNYTVQMAIDAMWGSIIGCMDIVVDHQGKNDDSVVKSTQDPSLRSEIKHVEGELLLAGSIDEADSSTQDDDDSTSPALALYPHIPPKHIDLHPDMTLRTGLFRTLPVMKNHPQLNEIQVYELGKALSNGYRYMTVKGPVLDTDLDLTNYLCLTHWFGRMNTQAFEEATSKPLPMTIEEFFSPIPQALRPSDYLVHEKLLDSLARLKTVALIFYPTLGDAEGTTKKRSGMVTNLAGTLNLRRDGKIEISPTPELRNLYTSTKRLMPLNRSSVIGLPSQMARILALWLAAKPGYTDNEWTRLNNLMISAGDLLMEIHPKEKHNHNDLQLISDALNAMSDARLVKYEVKFINSKYDDGRARKLTLKSQITFNAHRLANKRVFIATQLTDEQLCESLGNPLFPTKTTQLTGGSEVKLLLNEMKFPRGHAISDKKLEEWLSVHGNNLNAIAAKMRKAFKKSPREAIKLLTGVNSSKKNALMNFFVLCSREDDAAMMRDILICNPQRDKQSTIESLIRSIPIKPASVSGSEWYANNQKTVAAIKAALKKSTNPLNDMASIHKRVLFGRLINPLLAAEQNRDAEYFRGLYDAGKDGAEDDAVAERNRKRRR
jgi:hypothetical protein